MSQDHTTRGLEVLNFNNSELTTSIDHTFTSKGPLRVIYFPSQVRFMLNLNDWNYALTKRLPVTASSRTDEHSRYFILPGPKGTFTLKLSNFPSPAAIHNFDTVMSHSTSLSYKDEGYHDHNTSMDAKLLMDESHSHSIFGELHENNLGMTTDARLDVKDLLDDGETSHEEENIMKENIQGPNMMEVKNIDEIKRTPEDQVEVFELSTIQVLGAIERSREIEEKLNDSIAPSLALTSDRATADTLTAMTLEKLMDEHSAILTSPEASTGARSVSSFLGLTGLAAKNEEELLNEVYSERKIQEEARKLQEEARVQEWDSIRKERKAREELMTEAMFEDYDVLEMSERERVLVEQLNDVKEKLNMYEDELMTERFDAKHRERELAEELEKLGQKLAERGELLDEERKIYQNKEKVLNDLIFHCECYTKELEEKCEQMKQNRKERDLELKERLEDVKMMAKENKESMGWDNEDVYEMEKQAALKFNAKEKELKRELGGYNKMKKMLEDEVKSIEREKKRLEDIGEEIEQKIINGIEAIQNKEAQIEETLENIVRKELELENVTMQVEIGLKNLEEQEIILGIKKEEMNIKEENVKQELEEARMELQMEETEFLSKVQEFMDLKQSREKTIDAQDTLIKGRKEELWNQIKQIENEIIMEKENMEKDYEDFKQSWAEREKYIEEARIVNEMKKAEMELNWEKNEVILDKLENEISQKEVVKEEKVKGSKIVESKNMMAEMEHKEKLEKSLNEVKLVQWDMMKINKEIEVCHGEIMYEIMKAEWELSQPMEFQKELELYFARIEMNECMQDSP